MKFILPIVVFIFITACCNDSTRNKHFLFYNFFIDRNDNINIEYRPNIANDENTYFIQLDKDTHKWYKNEDINKSSLIYIDTHSYLFNSSLITDEDIKISNNKMIIKDVNGTVIYQGNIPTIDKIAEETDIELPSSFVSYTPFRTEKYNRWDRKTIIASIGINEEDRSPSYDDYDYSKVYYFYLIKENTTWNINYIKQKNSNRRYTKKEFLPLQQFSIDDKAKLCTSTMTQKYNSSLYNDIQCFQKEEDRVVLKELFGEIYDEEYKSIIAKYKKTANKNVHLMHFFDSDNNFHLFYSNPYESKGKYFNYVMYEENDLTTPKYEQKIEWKE